MSDIHAVRVLQVADAERYRRFKEYGDDLDEDQEPDSGPQIRYRTMQHMNFGVLGPETVYAQVLPDPELGGFARLAKEVLEAAQHNLGLGGTVRRTTPERYELDWTEKR